MGKFEVQTRPRDVVSLLAAAYKSIGNRRFCAYFTCLELALLATITASVHLACSRISGSYGPRTIRESFICWKAPTMSRISVHSGSPDYYMHAKRIS